MAEEADTKAGYPAGGPPEAGGPSDDAEGAEGMPDMAGMEEMMAGMGGMGGMGGGGEGGAGGMDMSALMAMLGKGGGKGGGGMGGMEDMMGGMGGKGGGKGGAQPPADEGEKAGRDGKWHWQQKGEEIQVRVVLDPPATKKDINVKFKASSLVVAVRGETIIDGTLGGKIEVDECTWCLSADKSELQVMLTQVAGKTDAWRDLLA